MSVQIQFFGRQVSSEKDFGAHIRVNVSNGNFKLSESVMKECKIDVGDKVNFGFAEDEDTGKTRVFLAHEDKGNTVGKGGTFTSQSNAKRLNEVFGDDESPVLILGVETEYDKEAYEATGGKDGGIKAYEVTFLEGQDQKGSEK